MRQFAYIGDGDTVAFGLSFPHGVPVRVDDSDPVRLRKLVGNRFFAEIIDGVEILDAVAPSAVKRGPGRPRKDRQ